MQWGKWESDQSPCCPLMGSGSTQGEAGASDSISQSRNGELFSPEAHCTLSFVGTNQGPHCRERRNLIYSVRGEAYNSPSFKERRTLTLHVLPFSGMAPSQTEPRCNIQHLRIRFSFLVTRMELHLPPVPWGHSSSDKVREWLPGQWLPHSHVASLSRDKVQPALCVRLCQITFPFRPLTLPPLE